MIGVLGPIIFQVSDQMMLTFADLRRRSSARWAEHDVFGRKPVREFIGPGLESISLSVRLDASFGVAPADEVDRMFNLMNAGAVNQFTVGGKLLGDFVILDVEDDERVRTRRGELLIATVGLQLGEYE